MTPFSQKSVADTRIMVGVSGGVDSSVVALLLKKQGYQVQAVFMQNWDLDGDDPFCSANQDLSDAQAVCDRLNIPLKTVRFAETYWDKVFQHFLDEYASGRTPNPDILCNKEIKFRAFLDYALAQEVDYIAMGHYARNVQKNEQYQLLKGADVSKDQSYFLYTLQQDQLRYSLFPLGDMKKSAVRAIAVEAGLITHDKKDSTGICFIGERKFKDFLGEYLLARPGKIQTETGRVLGEHSGLMFYTIGQRRGLGIGGVDGFSDMPWYVLDKDLERNVLIVGQNHEHPQLLKPILLCTDMHWVSGKAPELPLRCSAKVRYRQVDAACTLMQVDDSAYQVTFDEPQWAITPGQSVVLYLGDVCLGGGVIE
ncbi:MAG: tRNA (5-methylaminomethyl-2-thiouridylate)-methyltransferase [Gammaproteobacteria bacterium]|jgi:tRNA-specific 2-thiouridylase|nr:tRNA (5-methylaminomethyl-2-thiouridylate)-methyltransferase [Gammaproteobacteria bacterium]